MIFAVIAGPGHENILDERIRALYPDKHIQFHTKGHWFVASTGTAEEVSDRLGISADKPDDVRTAIVLGVSGYWGRESANIWEWLTANGG